MSAWREAARRAGRLLLLGACAAVGTAATASASQPSAPQRTLEDSLVVSVLTWGQGDAVFERFGHNALRIRNLRSGSDLAYNWGMFDFEQPNFLSRFLSGDTRYWVEAFPTDWMVQAYAEQDRETVEQVLALTPEQKAALTTFVETQVLEENKYYRYDYFLDNCSTRLRDALDFALDGRLRGRFTPMRTDLSFRNESVRLTAGDAMAQAGIDVALGPRADESLTAWDAMFIPMRLRDYLREVTVPAPDGGTQPLVLEERQLHVSSRPPQLPERRGLSLGAWGPVLGAWMLLLAPFGAGTRRRTRVPAAVMAALFYTVIGLVGVLLVGMWLFSAHVFWYNNLNVLLFSPLGLVAAWPVMRSVLSGTRSRLASVFVAVMAGGALGTLLAAPFAAQSLGGPLLLVLPAHLGLAFTWWRHTQPLQD